MTPFTSDTANRLAAKLAALDLEVDEQAALDAILDRAADAGQEVAGFAWQKGEPRDHSRVAEDFHKVKPPDLTAAGIRIGDALGLKL